MKHQYNQCSLLSSSDGLIGYSSNPAFNLSNLDFFGIHSNIWRFAMLTISQSKLLDELIADDEYNPLDPLQQLLEYRLHQSLSKD